MAIGFNFSSVQKTYNFNERILMDEKAREQIALFRYSVIGSLISGELLFGDLQKRIRELASRKYSIPHSKRTHIGAGTIEEWLYDYRNKNFEGLKPQNRSDQGKTRTIDEQTIKAIAAYKQEHPRAPVRLVLNKLREEKIIPQTQAPLSTVYRFLRLSMPHRKSPVTGKEQKRFAHRFPNDCWQGDVMHGPYIKEDGGAARKTYLVAFIDDATRLIVGAKFFFSEAVVNIKEVIRGAILIYGVPSKLYLDNGRNFCADDIEIACAIMKCALIHSTAYYPEGKGKIERFFRTVRDSFLSIMQPVDSLQKLNDSFADWLQQHYNRSSHSSLDGATPLDTFLAKAENRIRRLAAHIDPNELFCKKEERLVAKDGTFRVNNILYETEEHLIGRKIAVLYDKDDPAKIVKVYDKTVFVHSAKPIDYLSNANAKRKEINNKEGQ
jgi:transposase InsO family protein